MALYLGHASFLIGSGFSMYLTENTKTGKSSAPNYNQLLNYIFHAIKNQIDSSSKKTLSDFLKKTNISSQIKAGVLNNKINEKSKKHLMKKIVSNVMKDRTKVESLNNKNIIAIQKIFNKYPKNGINVFTTNYDDLIEHYLLKETSISIYNHANSNVIQKNINKEGKANVYHMHVNQFESDNIVITLEDYYDFEFNAHLDYIQQKFRTVLQEQTKIILGYSLGDFNINRFLTENRKMYSTNLHDHIYYVTIDDVSEELKLYYSNVFGVHVIDNQNLITFFKSILGQFDVVKKKFDSYKEIESLILENEMDKNEIGEKFLKNNELFPTIVSVWAIKKLINLPLYIYKLIELLKFKKENTTLNGKFSEYASLAEWIIVFLKTVQINNVGDEVKKDLINIILYSWNRMSEKKKLGYSWDAYKVWKCKYKTINNEITKKFLKGIINDNEFIGKKEIKKIIS